MKNLGTVNETLRWVLSINVIIFEKQGHSINTECFEKEIQCHSSCYSLCELSPLHVQYTVAMRDFFVFFISSDETREALLNWSKNDEAERFCIVDGNIQTHG